MISYLRGKLIFKKEKFIILEVSGIGFEIFLSSQTLEKMPKVNEDLRLFCYLDIGERSLKLYGFLNYEELDFFRLLRNISGIGPKASLEISSIGPPQKIREQIEKGNEKIFEGIPGIGKKKAKKIILELSGKLKKITISPKKYFLEDKAFLALVNLGFKKEEIKNALSQIPKEVKDNQEIIKRALKFLGRK